jgi:hypothetical protein
MTYWPRVPTRDTELGLERRCSGCAQRGEPDPYWPVDEEFWYMVNGKPLGRCRACWSERPRVDGVRRFQPMVSA